MMINLAVMPNTQFDKERERKHNGSFHIHKGKRNVVLATHVSYKETNNDKTYEERREMKKRKTL